MREILNPVSRASFDSPVMAAATKLNQQQIQAILDLHKYVSNDSFKAYVECLDRVQIDFPLRPDFYYANGT